MDSPGTEVVLIAQTILRVGEENIDPTVFSAALTMALILQYWAHIPNPDRGGLIQIVGRSYDGFIQRMRDAQVEGTLPELMAQKLRQVS